MDKRQQIRAPGADDFDQCRGWNIRSQEIHLPAFHLKEVRSHSRRDKVMFPFDTTNHHAIGQGTGSTLYQPKLVHLSQSYLRCEVFLSDIDLSIAPQFTNLKHRRSQNLKINVGNGGALGDQLVNDSSRRVAVSIQQSAVNIAVEYGPVSPMLLLPAIAQSVTVELSIKKYGSEKFSAHASEPKRPKGF